MSLTIIVGQLPPSDLAKFQNKVEKLGNVLQEKSFPKPKPEAEGHFLPEI